MGRWAPFVLSVLRCSFGQHRRNIPAQLLPAPVETYLAELGWGGGCLRGADRAQLVPAVKDPWVSPEHGHTDEEDSWSSPAEKALTRGV